MKETFENNSTGEQQKKKKSLKEKTPRPRPRVLATTI